MVAKLYPTSKSDVRRIENPTPRPSSTCRGILPTATDADHAGSCGHTTRRRQQQAAGHRFVEPEMWIAKPDDLLQQDLHGSGSFNDRAFDDPQRAFPYRYSRAAGKPIASKNLTTDQTIGGNRPSAPESYLHPVPACGGGYRPPAHITDVEVRLAHQPVQRTGEAFAQADIRTTRINDEVEIIAIVQHCTRATDSAHRPKTDPGEIIGIVVEESRE